ncbi:ATP-dependent nuclease [Thorsellia anophelis]|uniref:Putative ATP-dependent endonuclease of the OLD family n=1 Tax=Thorsellia anophelis DSM 18579 TaxID=1123402 RepID=A0A1H9Z6Y4_9GAMM|nr:ATP-dependent endonuclease [Thorsellia anophelis]SES77212.1 putative ATP-dependent endonuclease of the OLD family [Thorsellia anophelis DSM 18579]
MYIKHIDISGFRGINRLALSLKSNSVLIGENAWGKTSLLDALSLLAPSDTLYQFTQNDFHFPPGDSAAKHRNLQIIFTYCQDNISAELPKRYVSFEKLWVPQENDRAHIYLSLEAELDELGNCQTKRSFLDINGEKISDVKTDFLMGELIRFHPILRLRDARFINKLSPGAFSGYESLNQQALKQQLTILTERLAREPQSLSNQELKDGLGAMQQLLEHYLSGSGIGFKPFYTSPINDRQAWQSLDAINTVISQSSSRTVRMVLLGLMITLIEAKNNVRLDMDASPILVIEDPEKGLHPVNLAIAWGFFNQLPLQRITLTNSGDLLTLTPIKYIHRLIRESTKVTAYKIKSEKFATDELRRIGFHIRMNRATSLFARAWLLVEGETEVWLLTELTRLCGYNLEAEGIKIIEYAQCGLKPLIKFAQQLGIEWHVLTDGDEAGKRYSQTALSFAPKHDEARRLTTLPAFDMEHFMYRSGFMHVYKRVAQLPESPHLSARKIIDKAIHRSSKPDLAIEVALEAERLGIESIPLIIRKVFARIVGEARGRAE